MTDPYRNKYDYVMSREDFENMMNSDQYPFVQVVTERPRTYQDMLASKLQHRGNYQSRLNGRFNKRMFPRERKPFYNTQESPDDGTWSGSSDWVANWIESR